MGILPARLYLNMVQLRLIGRNFRLCLDATPVARSEGNTRVGAYAQMSASLHRLSVGQQLLNRISLYLVGGQDAHPTRNYISTRKRKGTTSSLCPNRLGGCYNKRKHDITAPLNRRGAETAPFWFIGLTEKYCSVSLAVRS